MEGTAPVMTVHSIPVAKDKFVDKMYTDWYH